MYIEEILSEHTHKHTKPVALPGPLAWTVKICNRSKQVNNTSQLHSRLTNACDPKIITATSLDSVRHRRHRCNYH